MLGYAVYSSLEAKFLNEVLGTGLALSQLVPILVGMTKLVLQAGLTSQVGVLRLGAIHSVDVPDSALPPLPPCDPPHAEMAGIWTPGRPRRHQTQRL